jgi:quinolinate synthase
MNTEKRDLTLTEEEAMERIAQLKKELGTRVVILGHHYQRDEVVQFADYRGDSLELSRIAADQAHEAEYIVFCGVDFMAETAAMLCQPHQTVVMPARNAGCPMARMADALDAQIAWDALTRLWGDDITPITYQNSYATVKAFCGQHGGAVCTSSNCQALFQQAWSDKGHILFLPDEHLGTNSALALGVPREQIAVWDPDESPDDLTFLERARIVVWKGFCNVHTRFTVEHVRQIREKYDPITIIVHPECRAEVVAVADQSGSTSFILKSVEDAPAGSRFAIGTEINMVSRLATENPDKLVVPLARSLCPTMFLTNVINLWQALEGIAEGHPRGEVHVDPEVAKWANLALERMLAIK